MRRTHLPVELLDLDLGRAAGVVLGGSGSHGRAVLGLLQALVPAGALGPGNHAPSVQLPAITSAFYQTLQRSMQSVWFAAPLDFSALIRLGNAAL